MIMMPYAWLSSLPQVTLHADFWHPTGPPSRAGPAARPRAATARWWRSGRFAECDQMYRLTASAMIRMILSISCLR